jgi:GNAT superfamily N-acetyltransferase
MRANEFIVEGVAEEVNPEVTSNNYTEPSRNVRMGDFVFNARKFTGGLGQPNAKGLQIRAYDPKNLKSSIGSADLIVKKDKKGNQWLESDDTNVDDEYRSKGVATMMYAFAKSLGNDIRPSPYQSNAGKNMWGKWGSDAKHLGEQGVVETINSAILNKKFKHKQVIGNYTYMATAEDFEGSPLLWIKAYHGNKEIGHILFEIIVRSPGGRRKPSADYLESGGTEVDPAYRNKGIASTMYAYAKMLGNDIQASYNQTSQGQAMWKAWEKSGGAKHLIGTSI